MKESIVQKKSFKFSLKVISLYKDLQSQKEFILSRQLLRCDTPIWANIEEAKTGQSNKDFTVKGQFHQKRLEKQSISFDY